MHSVIGVYNMYVLVHSMGSWCQAMPHAAVAIMHLGKGLTSSSHSTVRAYNLPIRMVQMYII